MRTVLAVSVVAALVSGCAINQKAAPVRLASSEEICVIEDPAVRSTFTASYIRLLRDRGFTVKRLEEGANLTTCPITTTYTARWSHDFTIYLAFARLTVYRNGIQAGEAVYDAKGGGLRMDKWINADEKLSEMVDQLFPR